MYLKTQVYACLKIFDIQTGKNACKIILNNKIALKPAIRLGRTFEQLTTGKRKYLAITLWVTPLFSLLSTSVFLKS